MRLLRDQRGMALPMVIGMMMVFTVAVSTVVVQTSGSQRSADTQRKGQYAHAGAEAALATAISVLANAPDPLASSALPPCGTPAAISVNGAAGDYCGAVAGTDWTITARGFATGTSAEVAQLRPKVITQVASVVHVNSAGLGELWNRLYQYDESKCTEFKKMIVTVPVVTRGCLKLSGNSDKPTRLLGSYVSVGGKVELKEHDSIGMVDAPISQADIAGTCKRDKGSGEHTPCGPADHVYASTITTSASVLPRPEVNFPYWYANAKPGPMHACTEGGLPGDYEFDKNTTYNRDAKKMELTPKDVSYTCRVLSGSTVLGELSWDSWNQVLTVNGTIFFDGDIRAKAPGGSKACLKVKTGPYCDSMVSYNGRGTIYAAGKVEIEIGLCAGGDGSNDCELEPSNWDPTQNTLIFISGGLKNIGDETFKMDKDDAVFQGAVWSVGKCKIGKKASFSAPLICGQLNVKDDDSIDDPTVNPWPASLIGSSPGQVYPTPAGDLQILLREQIGG